MKKPTVIHIVSKYEPGQKADIHKGLLDEGTFNSVLFIEGLIENGAPFYPNTYYFKKVPPNNLIRRIDALFTERIFSQIYLYRLNKKFEKIVRLCKANIIHGQFGMAGANVLATVDKLKLPFIVTFFGVDISQCLKSKRWIPSFKKMFEKADRLIVTSEKKKETLVKVGCAPEKIRIWNCLVDLDAYPYTARQRDNRPKCRFLTAARFVEKKGYPYLLKAFSKLVKKRKNVELTILGFGPLKNKILSQIRHLGIEKNVNLIDTSLVFTIGFPRLFKENLDTHDIFVLASTTAESGDDEGGPALTLVSAQAAGLPVICTPFVGSEQSVFDGVTGIIAEQDSPESLAVKMEYLMDKPEIWNKMGQRASSHVRDNFSIKSQTQKMIDIYNEIIDGRLCE